MSENRRKRRQKEKNKVQNEKTVISKRDKIIWISILVVLILVVCFTLFFKFLEYFVFID